MLSLQELKFVLQILYYAACPPDVSTLLRPIFRQLIFNVQSRGCIQRETLGMGPYSRADYNLTLCRLQIRLLHIYHGQPYASADLTLCQSRLYPRVRDWEFGLSAVAKFLVPDRGYTGVDYDIRLSYRPASYVVWRAGTTTIRHRRLYSIFQSGNNNLATGVRPIEKGRQRGRESFKSNLHFFHTVHWCDILLGKCIIYYTYCSGLLINS